MNAVVDVVCPEKKSVLNSVILSDNTITRRVEELSSNLKEQLHHIAGNFKAFSLALDESTDISNIAQLGIFVGGINTEFNDTEDLLSLRSMRGNCTGDDIFCKCNSALTEAKLSYEKLVGVATDSARVVIGNQKGFQGCLIKELEIRNLLEIIWCHCIIHHKSLCAKALGFNDVMDAVISAVNFIRAHALNHRQFNKLMEKIDANYKDVLYFSQIRWLSKGKH